MKKIMNLPLIAYILVSGLTVTSNECRANSENHETSQLLLDIQYNVSCSHPSDINEHLPHLRRLAKECDSVVELGLRDMVSSWGIIKGLSENLSGVREYFGVDLNSPPEHIYKAAKAIAESNGISFKFWKGSDLEIDIPASDMLFIDTMHTYSQLTYELETFSPKIRKYIAMHDTSEPFAYRDDPYYKGNYSEYPDYIDTTKRGTWTAVWDFLNRHPEWKLQERHFNSYGFTILKRVSE